MISCNYCYHRSMCIIRDPKVNKAAHNCPAFRHYSDSNVLSASLTLEELNDMVKIFNEELISNNIIKW